MITYKKLEIGERTHPVVFRVGLFSYRNGGISMNIEKEYVLEMKDITKHYGENTVLNGVSLSVKKGEIHALFRRKRSR